MREDELSIFYLVLPYYSNEPSDVSDILTIEVYNGLRYNYSIHKCDDLQIAIF